MLPQHSELTTFPVAEEPTEHSDPGLGTAARCLLHGPWRCRTTSDRAPLASLAPGWLCELWDEAELWNILPWRQRFGVSLLTEIKAGVGLLCNALRMKTKPAPSPSLHRWHLVEMLMGPLGILVFVW